MQSPVIHHNSNHSHPNNYNNTSQNHNLTFCYSKLNPQSLVMLYKPEIIVEKMMKISQCIFLWIWDKGDDDQDGQRKENGGNGLRNFIKGLGRNCDKEGQEEEIKGGQEEQEGQIGQERNGWEGVQFVELKDVEEMAGFLEKRKEMNEVRVICSPLLVEQVVKLNRRKQIKLIIEYPSAPSESQSQSQSYPQHDPEPFPPNPTHSYNPPHLPHLPHVPNSPSSSQPLILKAQSTQTLLQIIQIESTMEPTYRDLMNFVTLKGEVWKSNVLVNTMIAMGRQVVDGEVRKLIINQFKKMLKKIHKSPSPDLPQFLTQLCSPNLSPQRALYWYTHPLDIYKVLNNILRSCNHPSEIYYIQPIFKDIFQAIQKIHKKQKQQKKQKQKQKQKQIKKQIQQEQKIQQFKQKYQQKYKEEEEEVKSFLCYRGGLLSKEEIAALRDCCGGYVKNLGFMSASVQEEIASAFMRNAMFWVKVWEDEDEDDDGGEGEDEDQQQFKLDYGYANIKQYSYFSQQQQILFNPLNSFKILEITEYSSEHIPKQKQPDTEPQYVIKLEHGNSTKIMKKFRKYGENSLTQSERCFCTLGRIWKDQERRIGNQGVVMVDEDWNLEYARDYWAKSATLSTSPSHQSYALTYLALSLSNSLSPNPNPNLSHPQPHPQPQPQPHYVQILLEAKSHINLSQITKHHSKLTKQQLLMVKVNSIIEKELAYRFLSLGKYDEVLRICNGLVGVLRKVFGSQCDDEGEDEGEGGGGGKDEGGEKKIKDKENGKEKEKYHGGNKGKRRGRNFLALHIFVMHILAGVYRLKGDFGKAMQQYKHNLKILTKQYGEVHPISTTTLQQLASIYTETGNYTQSQRLLQKCTRQLLLMVGEGHPCHISSLNKLANSYLNQSKIQEAQSIYRKCSELALNRLGSRHSLYLTCLNNQAVGYEAMGKFQLAEKLYRICHKTESEIYESIKQIQPDYIKTIDSLARVLSTQHKYEEAWEFRKRCCALALQFYGKGHFQYSVQLYNLGLTLKCLKRAKESMDLFRKCCRIQVKVLEEDDQADINHLNGLADTYIQLGQYQKSHKLLLKSLALTQPNPFFTLSLKTLAKLALTSHFVNLNPNPNPNPNTNSNSNPNPNLNSNDSPISPSFPQPQTYLLQSHNLQCQLLGQTHHDSILTYQNLADLVFNQKRYARALEMYQQCYRWAIEGLGHGPNKGQEKGRGEGLGEEIGEWHPLCVEVLGKLGTGYFWVGDYERGLDVVRRYCELLGEGHVDYPKGIMTMINFQLSIGKYKQSLILCKQVAKLKPLDKKTLNSTLVTISKISPILLLPKKSLKFLQVQLARMNNNLPHTYTHIHIHTHTHTHTHPHTNKLITSKTMKKLQQKFNDLKCKYKNANRNGKSGYISFRQFQI